MGTQAAWYWSLAPLPIIRKSERKLFSFCNAIYKIRIEDVLSLILFSSLLFSLLFSHLSSFSSSLSSFLASHNLPMLPFEESTTCKSFHHKGQKGQISSQPPTLLVRAPECDLLSAKSSSHWDFASGGKSAHARRDEKWVMLRDQWNYRKHLAWPYCSHPWVPAPYPILQPSCKFC